MKEKSESSGGEDLSGLSAEELARRYYALVEERVKAALVGSKVLAKFVTQDVTAEEEDAVTTEYATIKNRVTSLPELTRLRETLVSREDGVILNYSMPGRLVKERDFEPDDIGRHILLGSTPRPQIVMDFLRSQPQLKKI